jgi:hypothetical protein
MEGYPILCPQCMELLTVWTRLVFEWSGYRGDYDEYDCDNAQGVLIQTCAQIRQNMNTVQIRVDAAREAYRNHFLTTHPDPIICPQCMELLKAWNDLVFIWSGYRGQWDQYDCDNAQGVLIQTCAQIQQVMNATQVQANAAENTYRNHINTAHPAAVWPPEPQIY